MNKTKSVIINTVLNGLLAQLVEQRTLNPWVEGSNPPQPIRQTVGTLIGRHLLDA